MTNNYEFSQNLARKGTPNLYLAANFLEPDDKFRAFLATYAAMRLTDDIVDDNRSAGNMSTLCKQEISAEIDRFIEMFANRKFDDSVPYAQDIKLAIARFEIPSWPFIELAGAMKFDIENDRFETFNQFLDYSEGAAVAPASIFMHLAASSFDDRGQIVLPEIDIREAARPLALFSYLVHVLRDFKKDFTSGKEPLIYLDKDTTNMFNIDENELAKNANGWQQSLKFTNMIKWYFNRLQDYQTKAMDMLEAIDDRLPEDGRFALRFIYELYSATAAKISDQQCILIHENLNLSSSEIMLAAERASKHSGISSELVTTRLTALISSEPISA
ncbi:MAG: squalene/phytoene synthase family protein [candidate division Zixibacteria bacterium]|nr:squalene/phytoene synthase family protein [candidate division Zixibacteria bacterium]